MPKEIVLPTLLMHLPLNKGPMNHCFQHYVQSHPRLFEEEDIAQLKVSNAFFGRKFPNQTRQPGAHAGAGRDGRGLGKKRKAGPCPRQLRCAVWLILPTPSLPTLRSRPKLP